MISCPKCSGTRIHGPVYERFGFAKQLERLRYTCSRCGYTSSTQTHDNAAREREARRG